MDNKQILHQVPKNTKSPLEPDSDTYREIARLVPEMQLSTSGNPHHYVTAQDWKFVADHNGTLVFGQSPAGKIYLVDGVPGLAVTALLELDRPASPVVHCADCHIAMDPTLAPHIPQIGHVCYDCLTYYVGGLPFLPNPEILDPELTQGAKFYVRSEVAQ